MICRNEEVAMETTTEIDPKNILDQDTESEDHETTVTSETLRTSPRFYQERELPADQVTVKAGTSPTNTAESSGATHTADSSGSTLGNITATEATTVPERNDSESADDD